MNDQQYIEIIKRRIAELQEGFSQDMQSNDMVVSMIKQRLLLDILTEFLEVVKGQ